MNKLKEFDLKIKEKFQKEYLVGMDEVGRGSFVSSLFAACVVMSDSYFNSAINDSKKLTHQQRKQLSEEIKKEALFYSIVEYSNQEIDKHGIQKVNKEAFIKLKNDAENKFQSLLSVVDGNIMQSNPQFLSIIKGDSVSFSIACASIIAKVERDDKLIQLAQDYPLWNLENNKGYGEDYIKYYKENGAPDNIHRHSFRIKNTQTLKLF